MRSLSETDYEAGAALWYLQENKIELIIPDLVLPDMTAVELLQKGFLIQPGCRATLLTASQKKSEARTVALRRV